MTDNIFKTFDNVADWLSKWRPGGRKDLVDVSQVLRDSVWEQKRTYSTIIFIEFTHYLDLQQASTDLSFSERREKFVGIDAQEKLLDILEDHIPFFPPPEHPLNENFDRFGTGEAYPLWNEVFAEFLSEYIPPQNLTGLQIHLWALHLFYSDIIKRLDKISLSVLFCIDLALTMATSNACMVIKEIQLEGTKEGDRTFKSATTKKKKRDKKKDKTIILFHTIEKRSEMGPYILAQKIQKRWVNTGPKDKIPSADSILRYLREEDLINPVRKRNVYG